MTEVEVALLTLVLAERDQVLFVQFQFRMQVKRLLVMNFQVFRTTTGCTDRVQLQMQFASLVPVRTAGCRQQFASIAMHSWQKYFLFVVHFVAYPCPVVQAGHGNWRFLPDLTFTTIFPAPMHLGQSRFFKSRVDKTLRMFHHLQTAIFIGVLLHYDVS